MAYSASQVTDILWRQYAAMLNHGTISEVVITMGIANVIGQQGIDIIAKRFRNTIQASVLIVSDAARNVIRVQPSFNQMGHSDVIPINPAPKNGVSKKEKLPRPPNAFILYRQHHHPLIKAKNPGFHNNQISIILGKQWKAEDDLIKDNFKLMADDLKKKHFLDHPEYQYQPRKPAEKKRRMTRRKAEALSTDVSEKLDTSTDITSNSETTALELENHSLTLPDLTPPELTFPGFTFPEFDTTLAGNIVFDMGNENLEEETMKAMLENFNATVDSNTDLALGMGSAALFTDPTEQAQNDSNFYSNVVDFPNPDDDFNINDLRDIFTESFFEAMGLQDQWAGMNPTAQGQVYNAQQAQNSSAQLQRSSGRP